MPSTSSVLLLSVTTLAALALYVTGSPVARAHRSADTSGDALPLGSSPLWASIIEVVKPHKKQFEDKFQQTYSFLDDYEIPAPEGGCPASDPSKESCLQRVAQGLHKYTILLEHVQKEYPDNTIPSNCKRYGGLLIQRIKEEMKHPELVVELSESEQRHLLQQLNSPVEFQRKMKAHNILRQLHFFLFDGKRAIVRKEM